MRRHAGAWIAAAMLLVTLGACGSDSPVGPGQTGAPAVTLVDALYGMSVANVSSSVTPMPLAAMFETTITPDNCVYAATTRRFDCAPRSFDGLAVTSSFQLLDASGALMASYDPARTAAVQTSLAFSGKLSGTLYDLQVQGSRELTLGGLLSDRRTLNGTSELRLVGSWIEDGVTYPFDLTTRARFTDLELSFANGRPKWPLAGSMTVESIWAGDASKGEPTLVYVATLTFSGSNVVTLTASSAGETWKCTVDLSNPGRPACP